MFKLSRKKNEIRSKEAFAVEQSRRSKWYHYPTQATSDKDGLGDLLVEDPIYHLEESSLQPSRINAYTFSFDTTLKFADSYVIRYECSTSSVEKHGISNYIELASAFLGESHEWGTLIIDRASFAFIQIERFAKRFPGFSYWSKPNLVYPNKKYFEEFIDSKLTVDYEPANGKWYMKNLRHQYTDEYFRAVEGTKDYIITDFYEWTSNSISRIVNGDLADKFFYKMPDHLHNYDKGSWANFDFPFFFCNKDSVYHDIERDGAIEDQFYRESVKKNE